MNIHEYQAKELLRQFGIPTPNGMVGIFRARGRRGRAAAVWPDVRREGADPRRRPRQGQVQGRVRPARRAACGSPSRAPRCRPFAEQMLGNTLVTVQTGPDGRVVNRIYVAEGVDIERELYLSALVDRAIVARRLHRQRGGRHEHRGGGARRRRRRSCPSPSIRRAAMSRSTAARSRSRSGSRASRSRRASSSSATSTTWCSTRT